MNVKYLKSILKYDSKSGIFVWKINSKRIKKGDIAGSINNEGYILIGIDKKSYKAHRLAWLYENGILPTEQIDHINHNRADNRIVNLRCASNLTNGKNHTIHKNNTSGVSGVSWHKRAKRWRARIVVDMKDKHLGYFANFSDAVDARKNAEVLYGFHENHGKRK